MSYSQSGTIRRAFDLKASFYLRASIAVILASATLCASGLAAAPDAEDLANAQWRKAMINTETPGEGCFQATFPDTLWHAAPCHAVTAHTHTEPRFKSLVQPQPTGNGVDYVLKSVGLISSTTGSFPAVSGVTSESSVGIPALGDGGILGPNEYTLQLNTNYDGSTAACAGGNSGCTVWQQFIYATDYETQGSAAVFMQYWLIYYGATCPSGYNSGGFDNCFKNSAYVAAPDVPATGLANLQLSGSAVQARSDTVKFVNGTTAYSVSAADSVLQIGSVWRQSEFNVFGDTEYAQAIFNTTSSLTVHVAAQDGSTSAPSCVPDEGSTGETNNLTLGSSCVAAGGTSPSIQFSESFVPTVGAYTDKPSIKIGAFSNRQNESVGFDLDQFGSISPGTTSTGMEYRYLIDLISRGVPTTAHFALTNLSADPGALWLETITALGVTKNAANATYYYSGGIAEWSWPDSFGFLNSEGDTVSVSINHN